MIMGKSKSNRGNVSATTRQVLWARAAGRCQYQGCNKSLIGDLASGAEDRNFGFVAHIVAATPDGPRGDPVRSPRLADEVGNLMLLCYVHHKLVDVDQKDLHPEQRLQGMKAAHERRIGIVTGIDEDRASHALRYAANIGSHLSPVAFEHVSAAMLLERFPADGRPIDIELQGSVQQDHELGFWAVERTNLRRQFATKVRERIEAREIRHISVFALAPQPLLIELGGLLCDIAPADVRQLCREPKGWRWPSDGTPIDYRILRPRRARGCPAALVLALSATIRDERVTDVLGEDAAIWSLTAERPHNDIMRRPDDLAAFRKLVRSMLDEIKAAHGEHAVVNVFPALPVSAAVELGRVRMPKADLPLVVYDQNRTVGGFIRALEVGGQVQAGTAEAA